MVPPADRALQPGVGRRSSVTYPAQSSVPGVSFVGPDTGAIIGAELRQIVFEAPETRWNMERSMARKFVMLGNVRGMPIEEIIRRVGQPTSISATANGQLYQWIRTRAFLGSYHYAISVDQEGKAIGYTHQFTR
jgi:hypothetical protein